jgi:hypothetical protein
VKIQFLLQKHRSENVQIFAKKNYFQSKINCKAQQAQHETKEMSNQQTQKSD